MVIGCTTLIRRRWPPASWSPSARAARSAAEELRSSRACARSASCRRWRCRWPTTPGRRCPRRSICRSPRSRGLSVLFGDRVGRVRRLRRRGEHRRQPRQARGAHDLPPPRILSIDVAAVRDHQRGLGVPERDRARRSQPLVRRGARGAGAGGAGAAGRSNERQTHAHELFAAFVGAHGYTLMFTVTDAER